MDATPTPEGKTDFGSLQEQAKVDDIVRRGPAGAFAVAGVATAVVMAIMVLFYLFVYLPRGVIQ